MENKNKWSTNEWEQYLEQIEVGRTENLLPKSWMSEAMLEQEYREGFSDLIGTNRNPNLEKALLKIMETLTDRQRQVLNLIFWQSKSLEEISMLLGIKKASVQGVRDRALNSIAKVLFKLREIESNISTEAA